MKRILITGSNGLLGQKLTELLTASHNNEILLTCKHLHSVFDEDIVPYTQLDTTNKQAVRKVVDEFEPHVIINAAAIPDVDECENKRELAWRTNVNSVENLIYAAKLVGAHLIHISTDYVFDGKNGPYEEQDRPNPINYYGKTKLASENILRTSGIDYTIVRTVVLYGVGFGMKLNFVLWVMKNLSDGKIIKVADDQKGNPTLVDDVAYGIMKIIELEKTGIFHIAGRDIISRFEFAQAISRTFDLNTKLINAVKSSELKRSAPRPLNSGLITLKAETELGIRVTGVNQGLTVFKSQIMKYEYLN